MEYSGDFIRDAKSTLSHFPFAPLFHLNNPIKNRNPWRVRMTFARDIQVTCKGR